MKKIPIGMLLILFVSCTQYKHLGTQTTISTEAKTIVRKDTVYVFIKGDTLKKAIDTNLLKDKRDTIRVRSEDSMLELAYWRDAYGDLQAACYRKTAQHKKEVEVKDVYHTKTITQDRIIIQKKETLYGWVWLTWIGGLLLIVLLGVLALKKTRL